ncbi:MAG: NAD-dependent epimerase/dehydratase family protein [Aquabacterium sp.]
MKLIITGATGYIGGRLVAQAEAAGHAIVTLGRRRMPGASHEWLPFDLSQPAPMQLPPGTDVLIHMAVSTDPLGDVQAELSSARHLLDASQQAGARFIFISSQTASASAPTDYGRSKRQIEQWVLAAGGMVIRPGQVYGGPAQALFGTLVDTVRRLPVLPAFWPAPRVQPVHVDDVARAILICVGRPDLQARILQLGAVVPVTFTGFLQAIASERLRVSKRRVPVPTFAITTLASLLGPVRAARTGVGRLTSLFALQPMDSADSLAQLGMRLRPFPAGMAPSSAARRQLALEAMSLLRYVLSCVPQPAMVRRYVRVVEALKGGRALGLPTLAERWPCCVSFLEGQHRANPDWAHELDWRLNLAMALAEATPLGARQFLRVGRPAGWLRHAAIMARSVVAEVCVRLGRPVIGPYLMAQRPVAERAA